MSRICLFADEAGCFGFKGKPDSSRYFILCTLMTRSCAIEADLLELRRELTWHKEPVRDFFHATEDHPRVRAAVFGVLMRHDVAVQATIMEKSKAQPHTRQSAHLFYQYAWRNHLERAAMTCLAPDSELLLVTATIGVDRQREIYGISVSHVCRETIGNTRWIATARPSQTEPCLQLADYCTWAIQRKWEMGDSSYYNLIRHRITYENDVWHDFSKRYF